MNSNNFNDDVNPLQPGETATCHVMLGVDDNGSLMVDGKGVEIPGVGKYHGGTYREKSDSFEIAPGYEETGLVQYNFRYYNPKEGEVDRI